MGRGVKIVKCSSNHSKANERQALSILSLKFVDHLTFWQMSEVRPEAKWNNENYNLVA